CKTSLKFVEFDIKVSRYRREDFSMTASRSNLERLKAFRFWVYMNKLAWLNPEGRSVHPLTINKNVAVHHQLTSLSRGAGKASANHQGVESHFKELNQVLTGQPLCTTRLFEDDAKLRLA